MKNFARRCIRSLLMVVGIILSLTSLAFLVEFAANPSLDNLLDEEYVVFILFALIGFPLMFFGINRLAEDVRS
jgi:hypothetical protein